MAKVYETAIRITAQLASTFKPALAGATRSLAELQQKAARLTALDRSTESFARLQNQAADAQRRFDTASRALDSMRAAGARLGVTGKALEKFLADDTASVKRLSDRLDKAKAAALAAGTALAAAGVDTRKLADEQRRLARELAATERVMEGRTQIGAATGRLRTRAASIATDARRVALAGAAAGVGLFAIVKKAADAGDAIDDAAGRLGIGGAALQALQAQTKMAGGEAEDANVSIGKLAVNIGKVLAAKKKGGGGGAAFGPVEGLTIFGEGGGDKGGTENPFQRLGLDVKKLKDLSPEQQLEAIADGVAGLKTQAEQAAAVTAVLGKGGLKMLPLLRGGGAALRQFREEGVRSGRFMSDDATKAASDFNDALEALKSRGVNGLVNALGGTLLPVGTRTFQEITRWISQNQAELRLWAERAKVWIEGTAIPAVKSIAAWFWRTGSAVASIAEKVAVAVGGFDNLAAVLLTVRLLPLAASAAELTGGLVKLGAGMVTLTGATWAGAAAWAAYAAPILALVAAGVAVNELLTNDAEAIKKADSEAFSQDELRRAREKRQRQRLAEESANAQRVAEARAQAEEAAAAPKAGRRAGPRTSEGGGTVIEFKPVINLPPGASGADAERPLKAAADDLEQRQRKLEAERRRVSFGS